MCSVSLYVCRFHDTVWPSEDNLRDMFFPSATWVLGIKLRWLDFANILRTDSSQELALGFWFCFRCCCCWSRDLIYPSWALRFLPSRLHLLHALGYRSVQTLLADQLSFNLAFSCCLSPPCVTSHLYLHSSHCPQPPRMCFFSVPAYTDALFLSPRRTAETGWHFPN